MTKLPRGHMVDGGSSALSATVALVTCITPSISRKQPPATPLEARSSTRKYMGFDQSALPLLLRAWGRESSVNSARRRRLSHKDVRARANPRPPRSVEKGAPPSHTFRNDRASSTFHRRNIHFNGRFYHGSWNFTLAAWCTIAYYHPPRSLCAVGQNYVSFGSTRNGSP